MLYVFLEDLINFMHFKEWTDYGHTFLFSFKFLLLRKKSYILYLYSVCNWSPCLSYFELSLFKVMVWKFECFSQTKKCSVFLQFTASEYNLHSVSFEKIDSKVLNLYSLEWTYNSLRIDYLTLWFSSKFMCTEPFSLKIRHIIKTGHTTIVSWGS